MALDTEYCNGAGGGRQLPLVVPAPRGAAGGTGGFGRGEQGTFGSTGGFAPGVRMTVRPVGTGH